MPFAPILAQHIAVGVLRRSIVEDQVGHAYLFLGPEGVGKRTTALAFAMALNCTDDVARATGDACGACRSCRLIALRQHPDVRLLTPETTGGKTVIPIDAIRTKIGDSPSHPLPLREDAQLKPLEGRHKVYVLDPANRPGLQEDAGNALLLTLEEPPPHVVIVLISSRPSAVLPTLVSRCRPVRFQLAPREVVTEAVMARGIGPEQAAAIAGMAAGRVGWAIAVSEQPGVLEARQTLLTEIARLMPRGQAAALRLAEVTRRLASTAGEDDEDDDGKARVSADRAVRRNLPALLDIAATWWRDLLLVDHDATALRINVDFGEALDTCAGQYDARHLREGLRVIQHAKRLIERNANIDLALETMWMNALR